MTDDQADVHADDQADGRPAERPEDGGDDARSRYARLTDGELVAAIRAHDARAVAELVWRFQPLVLWQARRFRVAPEERRAWVEEVLHDVALALVKPGARTPPSLAAYVGAAARHKAVSAHRAATRRQARADAVIAEGICSRYSVRASRGTADGPPPLSPMLERLARALDGALREDERLMLAWVSNAVPQRVVAGWLGISHAAALQRIRRLRLRLLAVARRFAAGLDDVERRELRRFFRRTPAWDDAELRALLEEVSP